MNDQPSHNKRYQTMENAHEVMPLLRAKEAVEVNEERGEAV